MSSHLVIAICEIVTRYLNEMVTSNIVLHDHLFAKVVRKLNDLKELKHVPHCHEEYQKCYFDWNMALVEKEDLWGRTSSLLSTISTLDVLKDNIHLELQDQVRMIGAAR